MIECYFCNNNHISELHAKNGCDYYICGTCLNKISSYIPEEQKWKLVQMRGDKKRETL
jgi:hypothetical protein